MVGHGRTHNFAAIQDGSLRRIRFGRERRTAPLADCVGDATIPSVTKPTEDPREALESDDVAIRVAAARVLAARGAQEDLPRLIRIAREDKSPSVRLYAAAAASDVAMRNRKELTDAAKSAIGQALKGYDPGKNPSLLLVLSAVREPGDLERLGRLLRDPRSEVRAAAATALRRLALADAVEGLEPEVARWLAEGRHPPDAEAELVRLAGEVGWTTLEPELLRLRFRASAAGAARALALERLAARRDPSAWHGLWVIRGDGGAIVDWIHVDATKVFGAKRPKGKPEIANGLATLGTLGVAHRVWLPHQEGVHEGLRVGDLTYWREAGKAFAAAVEELSEALADQPKVAKAMLASLSDLDGVSGGRARAIASWRAGEMDEAWGYVAALLKDKKTAKPETQILAARIRQAKGDGAGAVKLLRAALAAGPKKAPWRDEAEALLAGLAKGKAKSAARR